MLVAHIVLVQPGKCTDITENLLTNAEFNDTCSVFLFFFLQRHLLRISVA